MGTMPPAVWLNTAFSHTDIDDIPDGGCCQGSIWSLKAEKYPVFIGIRSSVTDIVFECVFHFWQKGKALRFAGFFLDVVDPAIAEVYLAEGQFHDVAGSHGQPGGQEQNFS